MARDDYLRDNLANWDERVDGHIAPDGYVSYRLLVDEPGHVTPVVQFDADRIGSVANCTLLHSQCHVGTDTMSWANLGATVTGIDFSPKAVAAAQALATSMGVDTARFVETEVFEAPAHLEGVFDVVYTSVGAICWLDDIDRWGKVMADYVAPGGRFYIRDTHPMLMALDDTRDDDDLVVGYRYFGDGGVQSFTDETTSYLGSATISNSTTHEWPHSMSSIINALIGAGLTIQRVDEHRHLDWSYFPWMEAQGEAFVLPEAVRDRVPLQFSILATKPA